MTKTGKDADGIVQTGADHHVKCPECGQWLDMRHLVQVMAHVHGQQIEEPDAPLTN